jgi:hypothetical protein
MKIRVKIYLIKKVKRYTAKGAENIEELSNMARFIDWE